VIDVNVFLTFAVLSTLTPQKVSQLLDKVPIFLRTLFTDKQLDPELIAKIGVRLLTGDLERFVSNMTQETYFYNRIEQCNSLREMENLLCELVPFERATIWVPTQNPDFLLSESLLEIIPISESIVGYSAISKDDIVSNDPSAHPGFNVDLDISLLRGCQSMVLLPIVNTDETTAAVLQCVGFFNQVSHKHIPFSEYFVEVLKIVRNLIQQKFFAVDNPCKLPASIVTILHQFEDASLRQLVFRFSWFIQDSVPCDVAEIFEFNDTDSILTRLNDGKQFTEATGGVSFFAARQSDPICLHHGATDSRLNPTIDWIITNRSILSFSLFTARFHFVITLRAKSKSPAFLPRDLQFLRELSPFLCETLGFSRYLELRAKNDVDFLRRRHIAQTISNAMSKLVTNVGNVWTLLKDTVRQLFEAEDCFLCELHGLDMEYHPIGLRWPFDCCPAGSAFNSRQIITIERDDDSPMEIYKRLKLKINRVIAFPYRSRGNVVGSIELINPKAGSVDEFSSEVFASFVSFLFPRITGVDEDPFNPGQTSGHI
jgi:GAF domain-containing protein